MFPSLQGNAILCLWLVEFHRRCYVHVGNDIFIVFFTTEMRKYEEKWENDSNQI